MKLGTHAKRFALAAGTCGALIAAVMGATASPATAAVPAHFTLCATGNYTAFAVFDSRHGFSSTLTPAGRCWTISNLTGIAHEKVTVDGVNAAGANFTVGSFQYDDSVGASVRAAGTATAPFLQRH